MRTVSFAACVLLLTSCHPKQPAAAAGPALPTLKVTIVPVVASDVPIDFEYLGRTEGSREVEIRARVGGFLEHRHFVEGALVAAGDLLVEIDRRPLEAQRAAAAAAVAAADARAQWAARESARLEPLLAEDAVSRKERDDALAAAQIAAADLQTAKAQLAQLELDLQYTRVTAPIAGKIGRALRQEGSLVDSGPGGLLTTLVQLDPIHVAFQRSENQQSALDRDLASGRLALPPDGFTVEIRQRDGSVLATGGRIDFTDARLDPATGTIPLRASLANADLRLRAGQAVKVALRGAVLQGALVVPQRAVVESPQGKIVMLAVDEGGKTVLAQRQIDVGEWVELPGTGPATRGWVIRRGIAAGDRVIVDNLVMLGRMPPGAPVEVVAALASGAVPPGPKPDASGDKATDGQGR